MNQAYDFYLSQLMHKARANTLPNPLQDLFKIGIYRPCLLSTKSNRIAQTRNSIIVRAVQSKDDIHRANCDTSMNFGTLTQFDPLYNLAESNKKSEHVMTS